MIFLYSILVEVVFYAMKDVLIDWFRFLWIFMNFLEFVEIESITLDLR